MLWLSAFVADDVNEARLFPSQRPRRFASRAATWLQAWVQDDTPYSAIVRRTQDLVLSLR